MLLWMKRRFLPTNNIVTAVGDSITIASAAGSGYKVASVSGFSKYQAQLSGSNGGGYLTALAILPKTGDSSSNGAISWGGVHATGGLNCAQIESTHIDGSDSPFYDTTRAGTCIVCAGQNDAINLSSQSAINTRIANVLSMCRKLLNGDIFPVVLLVPGNNTNSTNIANYNTSLYASCVANNILCVNPGTYNADGTYKANMHKGDGIHMSVLGALTAGQALRDALDPYLPSTRPVLVTTATRSDAVYVWTNGNMADVSSTAGVPQGGRVEQNGAWSWVPVSATPTLVTRSGYDSKAWRINKPTGDATNTTATSGGAGSVPPLFTDGDSFSFGFIAEVASWDTLSFANYQFSNLAQTNIYSRLNIVNDATFAGAIAPFVWSQTGTIPSGHGTNTAARLGFSWGAASGTARAIDTYIGQLTLRRNA